MAVLETEEEDPKVEVEADAETETDGEEGSEGDDSEEITYEQALAWKKKAEEFDAEKQKADNEEARRVKAEKLLVEQKKALKQTQKQNPDSVNSKDEVRRILAEERFYEKNPEAEAYRGKIEKYQDKGLSLEESFLLASKSDKEVDDNREVYGKSIVRGSGAGTENVKLVTVSDFDNMSVDQQNKYTAEIKAKHGVIKFK